MIGYPDPGTDDPYAPVRRQSPFSAASPEGQDILSTIRANQGLQFIQRILNPERYPALHDSPDSYATHEMASGSLDDGSFIAYPNIEYNPGNRTLYRPSNPAQAALQSNNYIRFPSQALAERFANNGYKVGYGVNTVPDKSGAERVNVIHPNTAPVSPAPIMRRLTDMRAK